MVDKKEVLNISVVVLLPLFKESKIVALTGIRNKNPKQPSLYLPYFYYNNDNLNKLQSIEEATYQYITSITHLELDKSSFKLVASHPFNNQKEIELCLFVMYKKQVAFQDLEHFTDLEEHKWSSIKMIDHINHPIQDEVAKEFFKVYG